MKGTMDKGKYEVRVKVGMEGMGEEDNAFSLEVRLSEVLDPQMHVRLMEHVQGICDILRPFAPYADAGDALEAYEGSRVPGLFKRNKKKGEE